MAFVPVVEGAYELYKLRWIANYFIGFVIAVILVAIMIGITKLELSPTMTAVVYFAAMGLIGYYVNKHDLTSYYLGERFIPKSLIPKGLIPDHLAHPLV